MTRRLPPQALEAEASVLASIFRDNNALDVALDVVCSEDFYREAHRLVFEAMRSMQDANEPIDELTVADAMRKAGTLEKAGGIATVLQAGRFDGMSSAVRSYARQVREAAQRRRLIAACIAAESEAHHDADVRDVIARAQTSILSLSSDVRGAGTVTFRDAQIEAMNRYETRARNPDAALGVATGFTDLDDMTGGLQRGELVVIAARPSMGKTAFIGAVMDYAALEKKEPTYVFSLEMTRAALIDRLNSARTGIPLRSLQRGKIGQSEWSKLSQFVGMFNQSPLVIDDLPARTLSDICSITRRARREKGCGLVIIDYLSKIRLREDRNATQAQLIGEVTGELKDLARILNIPVVLLVQINRGVEGKTEKRPMLSDLKDSGSIEQDADLVLMLYRDEYYNPKTRDKGVAEIIIRKQRNGPTGTVRLAYMDHLTKFANLSEDNDTLRTRSTPTYGTHAAATASD